MQINLEDGPAQALRRVAAYWEVSPEVAAKICLAHELYLIEKLTKGCTIKSHFPDGSVVTAKFIQPKYNNPKE